MTEAPVEKPADPYHLGLMNRTAERFAHLASLRGISCVIGVGTKPALHYTANGQDCGPSVHGLYAWLNAQPGVLP